MRTYLARLLALFAGTLSLLASSGGRAQTTTTAAPAFNRSFDADLFQPAIGPRNFLSIDAPEVPNDKQLSFGLVFDFQRNPYKLVATDGNTGRALQTNYLIASQYRTELQAAIGLLDRFQIGLALPLTLSLKGDDIDPSTGLTNGGQFSSSGVGDPRIEAKGQLLTAGSDDQFVLAALLGGTVPIGKKDAYLGNKGATGRAKALATLQLGKVRLGG